MKTYPARKILKREGFAAVRRAHCAPNPRLALASKVNTGRNRGKSVRINRIGNKSHRAVDHTGVHAAAMIA